jgi:glucoamylase
MKSKIKQLIKASRTVIKDCCLENGAIVAANSAKPHYPRESKNYFYVWPRDAAFTCMAADVLGVEGMQERFFDWLLERAEGWEETGLFYEKYHPNGLQDLNRFQPDQTGTVLLAIWHHFKDREEEAGRYRELVTRSAEGICRVWDKTHLTLITNDLWEEKLAYPDLKENFSYSLAACVMGLLSANLLFPKRIYVETAREMREILLGDAEKRGYFIRSFGRLNDDRIDSSLLGLIWPFKVVEARNPLAEATVKAIEEKLVKDIGVYRYEHDEYDGWMFHALHRRKGAGFWPLLNLWMSIVLCEMGQREKALKYYVKVLDSVDRFIPEQVFDNRIQRSVSPLCWGHSMFILASKEFGFL